MWCPQSRPRGRTSGHGSCRNPCGMVDSDRVTKRSTRSDDDPALPDSDTTVQYAPGTGLTPLLRRAHTATKGQWVAVAGAADILRSAWLDLGYRRLARPWLTACHCEQSESPQLNTLTAGATGGPSAAKGTDDWRDWPLQSSFKWPRFKWPWPRSRIWTCQWSWGDHKLKTGLKRQVVTWQGS